MNQTHSELGKPSFWQLVFLQSKLNGARYTGEELPARTWEWPKDTYLQRRLQRARWYQSPDNSRLNCLTASRAASFSTAPTGLRCH